MKNIFTLSLLFILFNSVPLRGEEDIEIEISEDVVRIMTSFYTSDPHYVVKVKDENIYLKHTGDKSNLIGPFQKIKNKSEYYFNSKREEYQIKIDGDGWSVYLNDTKVVLEYEELIDFNFKKGETVATYHMGIRLISGERKREEKIKGMKLIRKSAKEGFLAAQLELGRMYYGRSVVKKNRKESYKWYLAAAKQGSLEAQLEVGLFLYYGNGVKADDEESFLWMKKAALQENSSAQFYLGLFYNDGIGVRSDYKKAKEWFLKSAKSKNLGAETFLKAFNGDTLSMLKLSSLYYNGEVLRKNLVKAYAWNKAVFDLNIKSEDKPVVLKSSKLGLTKEEVSKAAKLAKEYLDRIKKNTSKPI